MNRWLDEHQRAGAAIGILKQSTNCKPEISTPNRLELVAAAATSVPKMAKPTPLTSEASLSIPDPYNPTAVLPQRVVKKILNLEFVEMAELTTDAWQNVLLSEPPYLTHRPTHTASVTDISVWLEFYSRIAAIIVTHFPEKAPELWAHQATILRVARNYKGTAWVTYDLQFQQEALARKDLNWSVTDSRLYNEAFMGKAKAIPQCHHCLSENHISLHCPVNPNPPLVG